MSESSAGADDRMEGFAVRVYVRVCPWCLLNKLPLPQRREMRDVVFMAVLASEVRFVKVSMTTKMPACSF